MKTRTAVDLIRAYNEGEPLRKLGADHPRDTCERCGVSFAGAMLVMLTVVDVLGHESLACRSCWSEHENARRTHASAR